MYCSRCHGGETHSLNIIPDLRRSAALTSAALWKNIVIDGALEVNGMIGWSEFLSPEEAETIRAYVAAQARSAASKAEPRRHRRDDPARPRRRTPTALCNAPDRTNFTYLPVLG